jgi:hypothetical protein
MANPIEDNATNILTSLFENNLNQDSMFDGSNIAEFTGLTPNEINNAVDYLDDRGLIERLNYLGTHPYNFGHIHLNSRGNYVYHDLQNSIDTVHEVPSSEIVASQPLAAGSPFGFTDLDWEYVQRELSKSNSLKVIFGYQFNSIHYDSEKLKTNLKKHLAEVVKAYNAQNGVVEINLNFKPLAAGYGEHLFNQLARDIISSDIAIFETSDMNPNVMLEIGVALTWGKRVLPIKMEDCQIPPADISGQSYADYLNNAERFLSTDHFDRMLAMVERAVAKKRTKNNNN